MGFITISKILMILILPFLLFLAFVNFLGFSSSFYQEKFLEYGVKNEVPEAGLFHDKIIGFIRGKSSELPIELNEREKQHLLDVRNLIGLSTILLYALIALFTVLLIISALILKINSRILDFVGKVLVFGGLLTISLAAILFFLINSNFSSAFETFHNIFFKQGTYAFDPAKEMLVRLYPEQLFMDLGLGISKGVFFASIIFIFAGVFLVFRSNKKNK